MPEPRSNYVETPNPFLLASPPVWFLDDLQIFDPLLVIFASQEEPVYRVGRRVRHAANVWRSCATVQSASDARPSIFTRRPDAKVMAQHNLVPVTSLFPSPLTRWGPTILQDLAERDLQRHGGADKYVDALEAREQAEEQRAARLVPEEAAVRARASWKGWKWRSGQTIDLGAAHRSSLHLPTRAQTSSPEPTYRPVSSESPPALFVGR